MRTTGLWTLKILSFLFIFSGVLLLLTPLLNRFWSEISTALYWLSKHAAFKMEAFIASMAFLLIGFICLSLARSLSRKGRAFYYHSPMGKVGISLCAIEEFLSSLALEVGSIDSLKPRVFPTKDGKKLRVEATVTASSGFNLRKSSEMVQRDIATAIKDTLGIEEVDSITISIDKIVHKKKSVVPSREESFIDEEKGNYEGPP